ncbi:SMAD/FHA domain [Lasallia pustulata]|uniref:SMAD/FHA domain n=1 Tax=Lasallia pustulata TaxID=136370 RepID=A0A1W5DDL4_9LECA|nr:SMAD/FHA domain [Lasallia pustulata]
MDHSLPKMRPDIPNPSTKSSPFRSQAVLTLTPIDCPTDSQPRVLTLHADRPLLHVGRSSRNASKGLTAAQNNAWFDSPTMSRQHASFHMTSESPRTILLEDLRSTHGTYVWGRRLDADEAYTCTSGLSITFGQKVTSGTMTFPAREFVLGIEWQTPSPPTPSSSPAAQQKTTSIGFCVPDDDDETSEDRSREPSVQIVQEGRRTFSVPDSPSSEDGFDSDDDSVEEPPPAGNSSVSTTPNNCADSGGKGRGSQTTQGTENVLWNNKNLKISCLLTTDDDRTEREVGTSPLNPIELDKEINRIRENAMVLIQDDGPEVLSSKPAIFAGNQAEVAPTSLLGHLQNRQPSLHSEHKVDAGEDTGNNVTSDSDMDDFENDILDEIDGDELYQLTEHHMDSQHPLAEIEGVRVQKMVKFLEQNYDSEDSDNEDNEDEDEDEDDYPNHFNAHYDEGRTYFAEGTITTPVTASNPQGSFQLGTKQVDQEPLVMVEDSQLHRQTPLRISTTEPINVGTLPTFINVDHRAPSPSDAALAKKPSFPGIGLSFGEDPMHPRAITQMSVPQSVNEKGHPVGPHAPSDFPFRRDFRDFLDNSNTVHGFTSFQDYRCQEGILDDSDHLPRYKQYLGSAASRAKASSISSKDFSPVRGAGNIAQQLNKPQRPVGPSPALSIKDLVDDNHNEVPSTSRGLKRKAAEISLDDEITASPEADLMQQTILTQPSLNTSQGSFLHNAQPRNTTVSSHQDSVLHFCDGIPDKLESSSVGSQEEPARKKMKVAAKRPSRFGAFISGFVVGGLSLAGAFAALIATVPNSVREETWREYGYTG